jgi:hypothetical protein
MRARWYDPATAEFLSVGTDFNYGDADDMAHPKTAPLARADAAQQAPNNAAYAELRSA